jgi:hypothetical protein
MANPKKNSENHDLIDFILDNFPYPIAFNYQRLLDEKTWEGKTRQALRVFEFVLRALGLAMVSQYLILDRNKDISSDHLNYLLRTRLPKPSLGSWVDIFFTTLKVYKDHRQELFMPELLTSFWDDRRKKPIKGIRNIFDDLVGIRNELAHGFPPNNETSWQALFEATNSHLLTVFDYFSFISNYVLINISRQEGNKHSYQIYRGTQIKEAAEPLLTDPPLGEGWFYLAKGKVDTQKILKLYPFLVAWEEDIDDLTVGIQSDAALLDKFSNSNIFYLATVLWKSISLNDEAHLADFFYTFERALDQKRRLARHLTWDAIKEVAEDISNMRMGDAFDKYNPAIYLQRDDVKLVFDKFLESEKTCLVITGKSGVGKSNFVISLANAYQEDDQVCTILYNGARIPSDKPITEIIYSDFRKFIELGAKHKGLEETLWQLLASIPDVKDKKIILFIDAINENLNPARMLRQLDFLIESNIYSWLKIVLTSRPEAWRTMTRKTSLAEHRYFWQLGHENLGIEIEEFYQEELQEGPVSIEHFSQNELFRVYKKYQKHYQLRTDYDKLPIPILTILKDPLILRLIAEIYQKQEIPPTIRGSDIYQDYVNALLESKRLYPEDLRFLNSEIVIRMVDKLENIVSEEDILVDEKLYERIFSSDPLANGQPVNASFINLVDTEILAPMPDIGTGSVSFKFERFYEHFAGERLYVIHTKIERGITYLEDVTSIANEKPFLLGVIKNSLHRILQDGNIDTIKALSASSSALSRDIAVTVLTDYSQVDSNLTNEILLEMAKNMTLQHELSEDQINQAMVAIQVAGSLLIADILEKGVRSQYTALRTTAIWQVYELWEQDRQTGWDVLTRLINDILQQVRFRQLAWNVVRKKASFDYLEAAGFISIHILANHYTESGITNTLQAIWRPVIEQVLFISGHESWKEKAIAQLRETILSALIDVALGRISNFPTRFNPAGVTELRALYDLPNSTQMKLQFLADYLDPNHGDLETLEKMILDLYPTNSGFFSLIIGHVLVAQAQNKLEEVLKLAKKIFYHGINLDQPGIISGNMIWVTLTIANMQPSIDDLTYATLKELIFESLNHVKEWHGSVRAYTNVWIDDYARIYMNKYGDSRVDLISWYAQKILDEDDTEAMQDLLFILGRLAASRYWKAILEAIKVLAASNSEKVQEKIVDLLARIHSRHKEYIDDFLQTQINDPDIRHRVSVKKVQEDIFETLGGGAGPWVDFAVKTIHNQGSRPDFIWLVKSAPNCKDFNQLLKIIVKWAINKVYGGTVFTLDNL